LFTCYHQWDQYFFEECYLVGSHCRRATALAVKLCPLQAI